MHGTPTSSSSPPPVRVRPLLAGRLPARFLEAKELQMSARRFAILYGSTVIAAILWDPDEAPDYVYAPLGRSQVRSRSLRSRRQQQGNCPRHPPLKRQLPVPKPDLTTGHLGCRQADTEIVVAHPGISRSSRSPRKAPSSIRTKISGSSCTTTGSRTGCSPPTKTSSTTAATLGTISSISPGESCPSASVIGPMSSRREDRARRGPARDAAGRGLGRGL
jgi:hypothetical protein